MNPNRVLSSSSLLITTTLLAGILPALSGCTAGGYKTRTVQTVKGFGLIAQYDSNRDRLTRFGMRGINSNMLYTRDLKAEPSPSGQYTFFGGMYTWVAPQGEWKNAQGQLQDWPPEPAMDVGPALVTGIGLRGFEATGPVMRSGLQQIKSFALIPDGSAVLTNELKNTADEPRTGGIWVNTAAIPGSVIAVLTPSTSSSTTAKNATSDDDNDKDNNKNKTNANQFHLRDQPGAQETWDNITKQKSQWTLIRTKAYYWWFGKGTEFKAFIPSDRVIAIHRRNNWLVRIGDPWSPAANDQHLAQYGEAPVEVYVNFGMKIFEAELLNPITEIKPGEIVVANEHWLIVPCLTPNLRDLDRALNKFDPIRFPLPKYDQTAAVEEKDVNDWLNSNAPNNNSGSENQTDKSKTVPMMQIEPAAPAQQQKQEQNTKKKTEEDKDAPPIDVDEPSEQPIHKKP